MALSQIQRAVCQLLAQHRISSGESYVTGGVALSELLGSSRLSQDIDLFHDTEEAVDASWEADKTRLEKSDYAVRALRHRPGLVEAEVKKGDESVRVEWARDSAYRFFPLVEHPLLGLALHPFDLATNKLLALVGRREVRDWVDVLQCDRALQPLGYLAWAACGKDPGFCPSSILEHAQRMSRFAPEELAELAFAGPPPDAAELARNWRLAMDAARRIIEALPSDEVGTCVLLGQDLCRLTPEEIPRALQRQELRFRTGSIRGAMPTVRPAAPN
ncbi:MAG TPA: nucleotidyl transferase AbiEii/AbiGii toxin family protein [Acidobacteriota bacterium]|nr:nucleotidyl transferase AbiEii/AbiGii toxin family protein [Acidobacteriota bacterium]